MAKTHVKIEPADRDPLEPCTCCERHSDFSILLACISERGERPKYYIPNQVVRRSHQVPDSVLKAVPFCSSCLTAIQENLRDTIAGLQRDRTGGARRR